MAATKCDIAARPIGAVEDVKVARSWIQNCLENHEKCGASNADRPERALKDNNHLPARVIDVGPSDGSEAPYLYINHGNLGQFVTLSHCWGNAVTVQTTKATLAIHMKQISMLELTKTFQDAIIITRNLGFRYLWIDSLCIIQDDSKDWEVQSALMASIYGSSIVTISAASSPNSKVGFIHPRPSYPSVSLTYTLCDGSVATVQLRRRLKAFKETVTSGPLYQRAWTFQERLLSRRILHYAEGQLHWECQETCLSEDGRSVPGDYKLKSNSRLSYIAASPLNNLESRSLYLDWYRTVEAYTKGDLTRASDKLPALSGLANVFSGRTGDRYLAGLWESDLKVGLLWCAARSDAPRLRRPLNYRAPSWSWAALDGHINFPTSDFYPNRLYSIPRVDFALRDLEVVVQLSGSDPYGMVASGTISATGRLKPVTYKIESESLEYFNSVMPTMRDPLYGEGLEMAWAFFDESGTQGPLCCFEVCSVSYTGGISGQHCLMLKSIGNNEYNRVGTGFVRQMGPVNWFEDAQMQRITIS